MASSTCLVVNIEKTKQYSNEVAITAISEIWMYYFLETKGLMNIGLLQEINKLPSEIREKIKAVGNDCFECAVTWKKKNRKKAIENPVEYYFQNGKKDVLNSLRIDGYLTITKAYLQECFNSAGCNVYDVYLDTIEIAEQACCSYKKAKKWASQNNVKKIKIGMKTIYQWTISDLDKFIECEF